MTFPDILFLIVALMTVGSAAVVVLSRSLIYSAFSLLFTFFGVAIIYVLLGARLSGRNPGLDLRRRHSHSVAFRGHVNP